MRHFACRHRSAQCLGAYATGSVTRITSGASIMPVTTTTTSGF
jgi:hypothetical protein